MFQVRRSDSVSPFRWAVIALLCLSLAALGITIWIMVDFLREQEIVHRLIQQLPDEAMSDARKLAGELKWQFRLAMLVVLNVIATACAVALLSRAYSSSQASLRNIKILASDILNSMDLAVLTTDLEGTITSCNRPGYEMLETTETILGKKVFDAFAGVPVEAFRREAMANAKSNIANKLFRDFELTKGDHTKTLRGFCQPLTDSKQVEIGSVLQLRDVTERLLIEQQIHRMERYMGMGSLAVGLHHEIKNPLAALSLHVQLLDEQLLKQNPNEETLQCLDVLKSEIGRITGVLESFRDYASIDTLHLSDVNVASLLDRMISLVSPQATQGNITVFVQVPQDLPSIQADQAKVEQMLLNLLLNAIQAMPDGGKLTIRAAAVDNLVHIAIRDTGPGIPDNLMDRVFDPYFSTKRHGTGMGLAICEKIVRQHQGRLELINANPGTKVEIALPIEVT